MQTKRRNRPGVPGADTTQNKGGRVKRNESIYPSAHQRNEKIKLMLLLHPHNRQPRSTHEHIQLNVQGRVLLPQNQQWWCHSWTWETLMKWTAIALYFKNCSTWMRAALHHRHAASTQLLNTLFHTTKQSSVVGLNRPCRTRSGQGTRS